MKPTTFQGICVDLGCIFVYFGDHFGSAGSPGAPLGHPGDPSGRPGGQWWPKTQNHRKKGLRGPPPGVPFWAQNRPEIDLERPEGEFRKVFSLSGSQRRFLVDSGAFGDPPEPQKLCFFIVLSSKTKGSPISGKRGLKHRF